MKTIFDKIDLVYLDCVGGLCEHPIHKFNVIYLLIIPVIVIGYIAYKNYIKS
jgi:hypothetical protein